MGCSQSILHTLLYCALLRGVFFGRGDGWELACSCRLTHWLAWMDVSALSVCVCCVLCGLGLVSIWLVGWYERGKKRSTTTVRTSLHIEFIEPEVLGEKLMEGERDRIHV